jgi:hypothetical protein
MMAFRHLGPLFCIYMIWCYNSKGDSACYQIKLIQMKVKY